MEELKKVVHFLYFGEIECEDVFDSFKVQENLNKIFGFPESLNQHDQIASLLDDPSLSSIIDFMADDMKDHVKKEGMFDRFALIKSTLLEITLV